MLSAAIAQASTATAAKSLRIPHELGFGRSAPMDPISPQRFYEAIQNVYSRLVRQGEDGRPSADLALEWPATSDAKKWIFRQRPGVTFHYGNAFTAGDVAFTDAHPAGDHQQPDQKRDGYHRPCRSCCPRQSNSF